MTREQAQEWARKATREEILDFIKESARKLTALEGSNQLDEATEQMTSEYLTDAADLLRSALEHEFATRLS